MGRVILLRGRNARRLMLCMAAGFVLRQLFVSKPPFPPRTSLLLLEDTEAVEGFQPEPPPRRIQVFYNAFLRDEKNETEAERVTSMINEQLSFLDPEFHQTPVLVTSIGRLLTNLSHASTIREHQAQGSEALTIHAIWEYCRAHPFRETKVVYLHSKGSFHDRHENKKFRPFLTRGALSKECANLPQNCDVCSSHMSPLPHPHTPGNMWLARCDYVAKLVDPYSLKQGKLHTDFEQDNPCRGHGRFFFEHWVHSHPHVRPCDLYAGRDYKWGYDNIPEADFVHKLRMAPRWERYFYVLRNVQCAPTLASYEQNIKWNFEQLYNITPDERWWGWQFFNQAPGRQTKERVI